MSEDSEHGDRSEPAAASVEAQPVPAQQLPPTTTALALGVSVADAEAELMKHLTPEHIKQEITNHHERQLRRLDNQATEIKHDHERDQRDRDEQIISDRRFERVFYVLLGVLVLLGAALVYRGKEDTLVELAKDLGKILVSLAAGMGLERVRRDRAERKKRFKP